MDLGKQILVAVIAAVLGSLLSAYLVNNIRPIRKAVGVF